MAESIQFPTKSCLNCSFKCNNEIDFRKHFKVHQYEAKFKIMCFYCPQILKTIKTYERHVKACKLKPILEETESEMTHIAHEKIWSCYICEEKIQLKTGSSSDDFTLVTKHCFTHAKSLPVKCPNCEALYDTYQVFINHINKHRRRKQYNIKLDTITYDDFEESNDLLENEQSFPLLVIQENESQNFQNDEVDLESASEPAAHLENKSSKITNVSNINNTIQKMEALFALKLSSKHLLSREVVDDIFSFCQEIHSTKMELLTSQAREKSEDDEKINKTIDTMQLTDNVIGLKDQLSTNYKRDKCLKERFSFIQPEKVHIGVIRDNSSSFYYSLPVRETLGRLLKDKSLRRYIINQPIFTNPEVLPE